MAAGDNDTYEALALSTSRGSLRSSLPSVAAVLTASPFARGA
ncbi:hypothetical protein [Haloglomus halophilum]|nr:hypothetical protein [Haloglomus halophilum]